MRRNLAMITLFALGVLLACDVGVSYALLSNAVTRNPLTIALTSFLESGPAPLFQLEQQFLLHAPLSVIALVSGLVAASILSRDWAVRGVLFWMGYAVGFSGLLCHYWVTQLLDLGAVFLIPSVIGTFCTIPAYLVGLQIVRVVRNGRLPTYPLKDLLMLTAACAILGFSAISYSDWISSITFLTITTALYYRLRAASPKSGEPSVNCADTVIELEVEAELPPPDEP